MDGAETDRVALEMERRGRVIEEEVEKVSRVLGLGFRVWD